MDDYLDSCESVEEAALRILQTIEINAHASWQMHEWVSNSSSALKDIEIKSNSLSLVKSTSNTYGEEKVLGLK